MAFDGMMIYALLQEMRSLESGRITKIYQPFERDIVLYIRAQGTNHRLLLSANPTYPRLHLTAEQLPNPEQAPMFCMVLRKYLEGGIIERIHQPEAERIVWIDVRSKNEIGDTYMKRLIIEVMGRHSNLILMDPETGKIIDSINHLSPSVNQYRVVLPGRPYVSPPEQDKENPFKVTKELFLRKLDFNQGKIDRQIVQHFNGISPLLAKEIVYQAGLPRQDQLWESFNRLIKRIKTGHYDPVIVDTDQKTFFYLFPLTHVKGQVTHYQTISRMLDAYFTEKARKDRLKQTANDLIKRLKTEITKNQKKQAKLEQTLEESEQADTYRLFGELLTAYMHQVERGTTEVEVVNYYDEQGKTVTIPLDPELAPNENAQRYFKKYNKAKAAREMAAEQLTKTKEEIAYLETLLHQLEQASWSDIEEIREEMVEQGYIRERGKHRKKRKQELPKPETFYSSEGIPILVGRNNKQNDYLTTRLASSHDTWLHTKDIPGSHVIIRRQQFNETTLLEAASLAAYFSKARDSSQVPVDYTLVKHVRKPKGAKPGFVIYDQHKTIFVTPQEELVRKLKTKT
ncbi:putative ribosome quality control (RQC) complex YloA/Tae2 family protein [Caldalkalibacillus uzonensis]|uniref:Rqc2 homolog RqcH n=1 Tax=Caldalkalibacillus uzonensis TaxID=353224 RepID=A0ABU0CNU7_9BACI|nr:NFACT RNA binding domain-containing protein [Caldalkalibacillus uzonensis]MDQ0337564.1 putative ribosome quality control (RQC) complex YloA/Tae2 family protein [Caldalkalibacillus uzonensis]